MFYHCFYDWSPTCDKKTEYNTSCAKALAAYMNVDIGDTNDLDKIRRLLEDNNRRTSLKLSESISSLGSETCHVKLEELYRSEIHE